MCKLILQCAGGRSHRLSWQPGKAAPGGPSTPDSGAGGGGWFLWEWLMAQSRGCPGSFMAVTPWAMEHPCVGDIVQPNRPGLGPHPAPPPLPTWVAPSIWLQLSQPRLHLLSCGGGWVGALLGSRNISRCQLARTHSNPKRLRGITVSTGQMKKPSPGARTWLHKSGPLAQLLQAPLFK